MSEEDSCRDPFEEIAEAFLASYRAGERPSFDDYTTRYPELADKIRKLLPALLMVEQDLSVDEAPKRMARDQTGSALWQLGDYRILREIGRGGMGIVYEAEQVTLGRRVALKVLPRKLSDDPKALERFRREAKSAARMHHTNIVPVFDVGDEGDQSFYAMQLIEGQGLDQVIDELRRICAADRKSARRTPLADEIAVESAGAKRNPGMIAARRNQGDVTQVVESLLSGRLTANRGQEDPASPRTEIQENGTELFDTEPAQQDSTSWANDSVTPTSREGSTSAVLPGGRHVSEIDTSGRRLPFFRSVAQIGRQAAQGLAHAHARGILHRDIKPSNLLLDTAGVVWITDFGLAKSEEDGLTATGDILGTLRFMAPERFRGEGDARSDIYALGLTLYELMTMCPAFASSDRLRLMEQIKNDEPARPRSIDYRIPRDLETIVLKALEKEPNRRYPTAEAMAEDLRRFIADEPIKARQVSTSERYWRWARRNPVIAVLGGVLTALLVATSLGSIWAASYFRTLAAKESFANQKSQLDQKDAITARRLAIEERDRSRQLSANLALEKGIALGDEGRADQGMLWMLESLRIAPEDAEKFRSTVRLNLGAWIGQVHKPLRIYETNPGLDLAFSPEGRSFARSHNPTDDPSGARPVGLWETETGRMLQSFPDAFGPFAFRQDGKVLVAATQDRMFVTAFDLATKRVLWKSPHLPGRVLRWIRFSADGSAIFVECDKGSWNLALVQLNSSTGQPLGEPIPGYGGFDFAPDGTAVVTGNLEHGEQQIDMLDLRSGLRTASWSTGRKNLTDLQFSPDGKSIGVTFKDDLFNGKAFDIQFWDPYRRKPTSQPIWGNEVIYSPSGGFVRVERDFRNAILDVSTLLERGSRFQVGGPSAMHPDGRSILTLFNEERGAMLWQTSADAEPVPERRADNQPFAQRSPGNRKSRGFHPFQGGGLRRDGKLGVLLVEDAGGRELIRSIDPETGRPSGTPARHYPGWIVRSFAFSPDGRWFATASNPLDRVASELRLHDSNTGRLMFPPIPLTNHAAALAFHPDGKILAAGDYNGLVRFWDTATGKEIGRPIPQGEIILGLSYSPDGKILAVGLSHDRTGKPGVRLWDPTTGQPLGDLLPNIDEVSRIVFRPDGGAFLGGSWRNARLWDTKLQRMIGQPMLEESVGPFSPDGRTFLTLGIDGSVKLRDVSTGEVLSTLLKSTSAAKFAAYSGNGGLVAAGFDDGTVRLCDPATTKPIGPARFMRHAVQHLAFSPDGQTVYAIDETGEFRKWPIAEPLVDSNLDDLAVRIEARTGLRMDKSQGISRMDYSAWQERLNELGRMDPAALRLDDGPAWHEPMIREAEQNGNAFAAIWHLDRLIAARPEDWLLFARRARARSLSDKFQQADADYREAERLGSREQVLDFQTHAVIDCTKAERWDEALWYLDRLIAARPDDATLHEERAAVYGKLGREADRKAEIARVFELGADEGLVLPHAEELGRAGRWSEAVDLLARCGRKGAVSRELSQAWSVACLKAGGRADYREASAAILNTHGPNPTVVWNSLSVATALNLGPGALDDYRVPIAWFEKRLDATPTLPPLYRHLFANALGGLLLRAGRIDDAITRLNEGMNATQEQEIPTDWAFLAIAHARKGDLAEARRWLQRITAITTDASGPFWDLQELDILRREAETLILDAMFPKDPFQALVPN